MAQSDDFIGLRQVWPADDSVETSFDVVAVHGIAGGPLTTWSSGDGRIWLQWLHEQMPSIRVLLFGYPATKVYLTKDDSATQSDRVLTFAESLCGGLRGKRLHRRGPITFIGHGVGGILIKSALSYCASRKELYGEILAKTHHIVFLDTPHLGLDLCHWQAMFGSGPSDRGQEQFGLWSSVIEHLTATFGDIASRQKIRITSAWATERLDTQNGRDLPLAASSARLGFESEDALHLNQVSHLTICRFINREDPNFKQISESIQTQILIKQNPELDPAADALEQRLMTLTKRASSSLQKLSDLAAQNSEKLDIIRQSQLQRSKNDEQGRRMDQQRSRKQELLHWLWPQRNNINWDDDLHKHSDAAEDTCTWLPRTDDFELWLGDHESSLVWLHGMQGSGKSTLAAYLVDFLRLSGKNLAFFFCRETLHSPIIRLAALAYQLLQRLPDDLVVQILSSAYAKTSSPTISTLKTAKDVLRDTLNVSSPCYIVVDALDECSDNRDHADKREFVKVLLDMAREVPFGLKLFCTSREDSLVRYLMTNSQSKVVNIHLTADLIANDIATMIESEIEVTPELRLKLDNTELRRYVVSQLQASSQGMFLLPKMMLKDLAAAEKMKEIYDFFEDPPTSLSSYYISILNKIGSRRMGLHKENNSLGKRVLAWLLCAKRQLTFAQLEAIISFGESGHKYLNLEVDIRSMFRCLVIIDSAHVRLSHPSVRRFFLKSPELRSTELYDSLIMADPHGYLGKQCLQYLAQCRVDLSSPKSRFVPPDADSLRKLHPFLDYACIHWLSHCRASRNPFDFVEDIRQLVCSPDWEKFLQWYFAVVHFITGDGFDQLCRALQTFVLQLQHVENVTVDKRTAATLDEISRRLRVVFRFVCTWNSSIHNFPSEVAFLRSHIDNADPSANHGQNCILLQDSLFPVRERGHFMLEKRYLSDKFDRFLLTDLNVVMWHSLMPSLHKRLSNMDTSEPHRIELRTESILPTIQHDAGMRHGLDPARAGVLVASTVVSKNLRVLAIVWPRFENIGSGTVTVKTYVWNLLENDEQLFLQHIDWTEHFCGADPCRADLTYSKTFKKSRNAVAFTADSAWLWTAGGRYNVRTGSRDAPPEIFIDPDMTQLTFSRHATCISGIRQGGLLEIYDLCDTAVLMRSATPGVDSLVDLSPSGNFALVICSTSGPESNDGIRHRQEYICLQQGSGSGLLTLWTSSRDSGDNSAGQALSSLVAFYNNGGLHAFSDNENILVLCVPTRPEWSLLAFDLEAPNIASSVWTVEYSTLLAGAEVQCLAFSPIQERQLHILDSLGNVRAVEISRRVDDARSISTLQQRDQPLFLSAVVSGCLYSAVILSSREEEEPRLLSYDLDTLCSNELWRRYSFSFLRTFLHIRSDNLVVNFDPVLQNGTMPLDYSTWLRAAIGAQSAIEATRDGTLETVRDLKLGPDEAMVDATPRISTKVSFDAACTTGFFLSVIYTPLASIGSQWQWSVSVIVDIRSLETPKARKTGDWFTGNVGSVSEEFLCSAYHEETKTLAYSVSLFYKDRSEENERWFMNRLMICHVGQQSLWEIELDDRQTYLKSHTKLHNIDDPCIVDMIFSPCGRYLYVLANPASPAVLQYDLWGSSLVRRFAWPPENEGVQFWCPTLSLHRGELYLGTLIGCAVWLVRIPFGRHPGQLQARMVAVGPHAIVNADRLQIIWPEEKKGSDRIVALVRCHNYLRKDGQRGGSVQAPIALSARLGELPPWQPLGEKTGLIQDLPRQGPKPFGSAGKETPAAESSAKSMAAQSTDDDADAAGRRNDGIDPALDITGSWIGGSGVESDAVRAGVRVGVLLLWLVVLGGILRSRAQGFRSGA